MRTSEKPQADRAFLCTRKENHIGVFAKLINDETGATAIEYGLIAALMFLAIVVSLNTFADSMGNLYNDISNTVSNAL